jgi:hypothetical protein
MKKRMKKTIEDGGNVREPGKMEEHKIFQESNKSVMEENNADNSLIFEKEAATIDSMI